MKSVTISFKTSAEIKKSLQEMAKKGHRSMSQQLEMIIEIFAQVYQDDPASILRSFLKEKARLGQTPNDAQHRRSSQGRPSSEP